MLGAVDEEPIAVMRGHEFIGQGVEKGTFNEVFGGE